MWKKSASIRLAQGDVSSGVEREREKEKESEREKQKWNEIWKKWGNSW